MQIIGAYEAKTHLAQILDRVAKGERITIAKHGVPVAVLQPVDIARQTPVRTVIDQMRSFRRGRRLAGLSLRELIEEGRD
jgi:prevent-host-death family protein